MASIWYHYLLGIKHHSRWVYIMSWYKLIITEGGVITQSNELMLKILNSLGEIVRYFGAMTQKKYRVIDIYPTIVSDIVRVYNSSLLQRSSKHSKLHS